MTAGRSAALVVLTALVLAGCGGSDEPQQAGPSPSERATLADLGSALDLRAAFNEDEGVPRLILLLSPT